MSLVKWVDIDRWTEIDLEDLNKQAETLTTEESKDIIKDALFTIKNSYSLLEKKKSTKEKRDRMTKERINILIRLGFQIRFKEPSQSSGSSAPQEGPPEAKTETVTNNS